MKGGLIAVFSGAAFLLLLFYKVKVYGTKGTIDLHLHDTYFVLSYGSAILFSLLFLGTLFSIGGLVESVFKRKLFWILAVLFLSIDTYYVATFYKAFKDTDDTQFPAE